MRFFRVALALAGVLLFAAQLSPGASAGSVYMKKDLLRVVDGDTIAYKGKTIRILGINAPELHRVCAEEMTLGKQAKAHAAGLVDGAKTVRAVFQYRKRRDGKVVRDTDKYGRFLAQISLDREDWAGLMIEAKLALPWDGKGPKPSWCPAAAAQ